MSASQRNPIRQDEPFSAIEPHGPALSATKSLLNRQLHGLKLHLCTCSAIGISAVQHDLPQTTFSPPRISTF